MMGQTILVVDDSRSARELITGFLMGLGYGARGVESGAAALRFFETDTPDLVILDAAMPEMDGFETCRRIRRLTQGAGTPIIMITGMDPMETVEEAFAAGVDEFLHKPLNWVVIRQRIRMLLERASAEMARRDAERRLQSVFETAVDAIVIIDGTGLVQSVNGAAERMFGHAADRMVGHSVNQLMPSPWRDEHDDYLARYLSTGASRIIGIGREVTALHQNGRTFPVDLAVSQLPAQRDGPPVFVGVLRDITERKRIEDELRRHNEAMANEKEIIAEILTRMRASAPFDPEGIRHVSRPLERAEGDILLCAARPNGTRHLLLGDVTGHGLSAALAGPLVTDIFYTMTAKGFAPDQILMETNRQLHKKLPVTMFLAACFIEFDPRNQRLYIWNGGCPAPVIVRGGEVVERIDSHAPPLGVLPPAAFDLDGRAIAGEPGDQVTAWTDGLPETADPDGTMFGAERLESALCALLAEGRPLEDLFAIVAAFSGARGQEDDLTLIQFTL